MEQATISNMPKSIYELPYWYAELVLIEARAKLNALRNEQKYEDLLDIAEQDGD